MFGADIFLRFCTNLHLREESYEQSLHYVSAIIFFCVSIKHNVSSQSTFYIALKHLKKIDPLHANPCSVKGVLLTAVLLEHIFLVYAEVFSGLTVSTFDI